MILTYAPESKLYVAEKGNTILDVTETSFRIWMGMRSLCSKVMMG